MDRRSELPDPRKVRSGSNRDKRRIPFLKYEDELVPRGRPAIRSLQKERVAIEIRWQREHSHTRFSSRDPLRSPQPPSKTYLKEAIHPSGSIGHVRLFNLIQAVNIGSEYQSKIKLQELVTSILFKHTKPEKLKLSSSLDLFIQRKRWTRFTQTTRTLSARRA